MFKTVFGMTLNRDYFNIMVILQLLEMETLARIDFISTF